MNDNMIKEVEKHIEFLLSNLDKYYYHNYYHTLDVVKRAIELWKKENITEEELEMLILAAYFHDTGFLVQYDQNEPIWASIARNYLTWIWYDPQKIDTIEKIILATNLSVEPTTLLEKIIKDADLDNFWREDFFDSWDRLKREIETIKKIKILKPDWVHHSIKLLKDHNFFTPTEISQRQAKKILNLEKLKDTFKSLKK